MVVTISFHNIAKKIKLGLKIMVLAIMIIYILPKLLNLFWHIDSPGEKIRDEHLLEKPLRVMSQPYPAYTVSERQCVDWGIL